MTRVLKKSGGYISSVAVSTMEKAPHSYSLLELGLESSLQNILGVADCCPGPLCLGNKVWMEGAVQTISARPHCSTHKISELSDQPFMFFANKSKKFV